MKTTLSNLDPWIAAIEDPVQREAVSRLDALIRRVMPSAERRIWGNILGYGCYHYKYASGREGDWFAVGLANQKGHVGVYLCVADERGYLAEQHQTRLGKVSCGKSCIRIKKIEQVNLDVLEELVETANRLVEDGRFEL